MAGNVSKEPPIYGRELLDRDIAIGKAIHVATILERLMFVLHYTTNIPEKLGYDHRLLARPSLMLDRRLYSNQHQHEPAKILCDGCLRQLENSLSPSKTLMAQTCGN